MTAIPTHNDRPAPLRLTVLNPGGRDALRDFSDGPGGPEEKGHAPVNFHGYAACTRGVFHRETKTAIVAGRPVLLLLRGDFRETREALDALQKHGLTTAVALKETGLHQIARQLFDPRRAALFREIVERADGVLAATPEAAVFGGGEFIPTPYPLADPRWDFSRPQEERAGIFLGTREWDVPSRHHFAAFALALELGGPVTLFEPHPRRARKLWVSLGGEEKRLRFLTKRLPYREYLAEIARHQIVLQADKSAVPGQVAGDALLCRVPCVGGDGAIDRLGFPELCGYGRSLGEIKELAARLLSDAAFAQATLAAVEQNAPARVGYEAVARQLEEFFDRLGHPPNDAAKNPS